MLSNGYAVESAKAPLVPFKFDRRELLANDVALDIYFAGKDHTFSSS